MGCDTRSKKKTHTHKKKNTITSTASVPSVWQTSCKAELVYVLGEEGINVVLEDISRLGVDN